MQRQRIVYTQRRHASPRQWNTSATTATAVFTQTGGTNAVGSLVSCRRHRLSGTYNLSGGLLSLSALNQGSGTAVFNFSGGTFQAATTFTTYVPIVLSSAGSNGVFDTSGNSLTLNGPLSGPGGLQKIGAGTLTLAVSNSYTGTTLVSSGTLLLGRLQCAVGQHV